VSKRHLSSSFLEYYFSGTGTVRIPAAGLAARLTLFAEGPKPGSRGERIPCKREGDTLVFQAKNELRGRWLYGVEQGAFRWQHFSAPKGRDSLTQANGLGKNAEPKHPQP